MDRHGLMWLGRGNLTVHQGTLHFTTAGYDDLAPGEYSIPYQMVSCFLLQPGTTVSHDVLRILARHGTGLAAVGQGGVKLYASMPFGPDESARARRQAELWANPDRRTWVARRMYGWRLGEVLPAEDLNTLRGIEGSRVKKSYQRLADQFGIKWFGRRYDRANPESTDLPNQAINHAAKALHAAAMMAVAVTGTIPQLGFIHEASGIAFTLDIADLFRETITLPIAFGAVRRFRQDSSGTLERLVRQIGGKTFRQEKVISRMIDRIKELLDGNDSGGDA